MDEIDREGKVALREIWQFKAKQGEMKLYRCHFLVFKGSDRSLQVPKCVNYGPLVHELWTLGTGGLILEGAVGLKQSFGNL